MNSVYTWCCRAYTRCCRALLLSVLGLAFLQGAHAACEPALLASKYPGMVGRTVRVGQDGESAPFSFRDPADFNRLVGLDADTARAVFACAGVPVTFSTGAWSGLIPAAMSGQIDVMWDTLLYTPERAKRLDFVYYMNAMTAVLVAKDNPQHVQSFNDICGLRGMASLGSTQEAMLRDAGKACVAAGKPDVDIQLSSDMSGGLRQLQNGRTDVFPVNKFVGDTMLGKFPQVQSAFAITTGAKIAAGSAKGNTELIRLIADGLLSMQENGELQTIYQRYGVDYSVVTKPVILTE